MSKYGYIYVVIKDGEAVFASEDEFEAETFCDDNNEWFDKRKEYYRENDIDVDDVTSQDIQDANFQIGYDIDESDCKVVEVNLEGVNTTEIVDVEGIPIAASVIHKLLSE